MFSEFGFLIIISFFDWYHFAILTISENFTHWASWFLARETKYIDSFILAQVKIGINFEILIIKIAVSISLYEAIAYFFSYFNPCRMVFTSWDTIRRWRCGLSRDFSNFWFFFGLNLFLKLILKIGITPKISHAKNNKLSIAYIWQYGLVFGKFQRKRDREPQLRGYYLLNTYQ